MPLQAPSVTNCSFAALIKPAIVAPGQENLPLNIPLNFSAVSNIQVYNGTYTPSNDMLSIFSGLLAAQAPNFVIILCDAQLNILMANSLGANFIADMPIKRFGFFSVIQDPANFLVSLTLFGMAAANSPMPQGVPVNYTIITGIATIT